MKLQKILFCFTLVFMLAVIAQTSAHSACPVPPGDWDYCTLCGPCNPGQGDCDSNDDCAAGLTCESNAGPEYGLAKGIDVCVGELAGQSSAGTGTTNTTTTGSGTSGTSSTSDNPYISGTNVSGSGSQGSTTSTSSNANCSDPFYALTHSSICYDTGGGSGSSSGSSSGSGSAGTTKTCAFPVGDPDYCFSCGPCDAGQGGCHFDWHCKTGLICDQNTYTCRLP